MTQFAQLRQCSHQTSLRACSNAFEIFEQDQLGSKVVFKLGVDILIDTGNLPVEHFAYHINTFALRRMIAVDDVVCTLRFTYLYSAVKPQRRQSAFGKRE